MGETTYFSRPRPLTAAETKRPRSRRSSNSPIVAINMCGSEVDGPIAGTSDSSDQAGSRRNCRAPAPNHPASFEDECHMTPSIDVYFEFASPYSYLAAQELPALAARHGRPLRWRPIELEKVWGAHGVLEAYAAVRRVKGGYIMPDAA